MTPETAQRLDAALRKQEKRLNRGIPIDFELFEVGFSGLARGELVLHYQDKLPDSKRPKWVCRIETERVLVALFSVL